MVARRPGRVGQRPAVLVDGAAAADPVGVGRAGPPVPSAGDAEAAGRPLGPAVGGKDPGRQAVGPGHHFGHRIGREPPEGQGGGDGDEGHPGAGGVAPGDGLDDLRAFPRRDLEPPELTADIEPVEARIAHPSRDIRRNAARRLDLGRARGDIRGEGPGPGQQVGWRAHGSDPLFRTGCSARFAIKVQAFRVAAPSARQKQKDPALPDRPSPEAAIVSMGRGSRYDPRVSRCAGPAGGGTDGSPR